LDLTVVARPSLLHCSDWRLQQHAGTPRLADYYRANYKRKSVFSQALSANSRHYFYCGKVLALIFYAISSAPSASSAVSAIAVAALVEPECSPALIFS
jgi:hypothetical protein